MFLESLKNIQASISH